MEIRSLATTDPDCVIEAFCEAFGDYEVRLDGDQVRNMLCRRGFDPALSFAAFDGERIVSFTCNGIGLYHGSKTAYDTGTGTLPNYRRQGLATRIFKYSIPHLQEAGVWQYILEVLQHNTGAVSVYRSLGFKVTREFNYFNQENASVLKCAGSVTGRYEIRKIGIEQAAECAGFSDFEPSWQNNFDSVRRMTESFVVMGAFSGSQIVGYGIFDPGTGDVTQIAVSREHRREGVGSLLLDNMIEVNRHSAIKVINTDVECTSITDFLGARNIPVRGMQFEMMKEL